MARKYVMGYAPDGAPIITNLRAEAQYPESWAVDQDARLDLKSQTHKANYPVDIVDRVINAHSITTCPQARERAKVSLEERDPWFYEPNAWESIQRWMGNDESKTLPENATVAYWHYGKYHLSEVPAGATIEVIQEGRIAIRNAVSA